MAQEKLNKILEAHKLWLNNEGGSRANLSRADLIGADLSGADLSHAYLSRANLIGADLSNANLSHAYLSHADLGNANLSGADLSNANLIGADLSGANGLLSSVNFMEAHFERTSDGYIVYKCFGGMYTAPENWKLEPGSIISEAVNPNRTNDCGCGINVAPLDWVKENFNKQIWKLLIKWEWLPGVIVPYNTDGKIRCERAMILGRVDGTGNLMEGETENGLQ